MRRAPRGCRTARPRPRSPGSARGRAAALRVGCGVVGEGLLLLRREGRDPRLGAPAGEGLGPERLGPPAGRVAELALEEADDRVGDVVARRVLLEVVRVGAAADEGEGQVADDLAARGHLDEVAEDPVGRGIHRLDLLEAVAEAEGDGLLAQVRQLPAGDLVDVDPAGGGGEPGLERRVEAADGLPVGLEGHHGGEVETGLAVGAVGRGDEGRQRRLARRPGDRGARGVDGVDPGVDGGEEGGDLPAGRVMGVQVDRAGRSAPGAP